MKPVKPKFFNTVKVEWHISKECRRIINAYSQYTKFSEDELIERAIMEILDDQDFIKWLKSKRHNKRFHEILAENAAGSTLPASSFLDFINNEETDV